METLMKLAMVTWMVTKLLPILLGVLVIGGFLVTFLFLLTREAICAKLRKRKHNEKYGISDKYIG